MVFMCGHAQRNASIFCFVRDDQMIAAPEAIGAAAYVGRQAHHNLSQQPQWTSTSVSSLASTWTRPEQHLSKAALSDDRQGGVHICTQPLHLLLQNFFTARPAKADQVAVVPVQAVLRIASGCHEALAPDAAAAVRRPMMPADLAQPATHLRNVIPSSSHNAYSLAG